MANDEKGATESQVEKIDAIVGNEVLGYEGAGREERGGRLALQPGLEAAAEVLQHVDPLLAARRRHAQDPLDEPATPLTRRPAARSAP